MTILTVSDGDLQGFIRVRKGSSGECAPMAVNAGAYLVARKEVKHYQWGDAQSCLAQFTNENGGYAPNNDSLAYQGAGPTSCRKYWVFFSFSIGHPRLPTVSDVQFFKPADMDRIELHPDVRLIERAPAQEFRPSITRIDELVGSIVVQK